MALNISLLSKQRDVFDSDLLTNRLNTFLRGNSGGEKRHCAAQVYSLLLYPHWFVNAALAPHDCIH
jgi:hypothetical protein